jgi:hypothetical protein
MQMKSFSGGLSLALLSFAMLGVLGCSNENESEINAQAAKSSSESTGPTKAITDQREYFQSQPDPYKDSGYKKADKGTKGAKKK